MEKRTALNIKLSPSERALIELAAKDVGLKTGTFVRWIVLNHIKQNMGVGINDGTRISPTSSN